MPRSPHRRHRTQQSTALLALQLLATCLHVVPRLVYAQHTVRTTTRVVAYLAELGPAWVLLFGVSALVLFAGLWWGKGLHYAHLACAGVWVFYAAGLWIGALADTPRGTIFFPVVTSLIVVIHVILAASYNEDATRLGDPP